MADDDWWYDLKTQTAVRGDRAGKAADRLGPYASQEEAEHAMEKVAERNESFDNDPRWKD